MVTVATFWKAEQAHLARMSLEASGIPAIVLDENVVQWDPLLANAINGIRVQVADEDLEEARVVLSTVEPDEESAEP